MTDDIADQRPAAGLVICDLDGVVWLAHQPIPGSVEAVAALRASGFRVLFATNNSAPKLADHEATLGAIGIPAADDVVSSAQAVALLVAADERVAYCGGPGIAEAIEGRGAEPIPIRQATVADTVVVGLARDFDYAVLERASTLIRNGARFLATNDDATYPTDRGPIPGGGAIVAAVTTASGITPQIAGKPHQAMADLIRAMTAGTPAEAMVMIGDRPSTDGRFATTLGCRYAQVRTGVTPPGAAVEPVPDIDAPDLAAVARQLIGKAQLSAGSMG